MSAELKPEEVNDALGKAMIADLRRQIAEAAAQLERLSPAPTTCTVCKMDYQTTGQRAGVPWGIWGVGFRVCKRCQAAGRDARREVERDE